jgi:hypothetical protein
VLTTHARPLDEITACVGKVGIDLGEAALFRHGTTPVINTVLEMDGARVLPGCGLVGRDRGP